MKVNIHFSSYLAQLFLEWKMFPAKVVERSKHIFSSENRAVYKII